MSSHEKTNEFSGILKDGFVTLWVTKSSDGVYNILPGYTEIDLIKYLKTLKIKPEVYYEVASINTCIQLPSGETLNYEWDVDRFVEKILHNKETYFD